MDRVDVLTLFGRQFGVATTAQLEQLGVSASTIGRARRCGALIVLLPGVVRIAERDETFESRAMAVQLYFGAASCLTATTAGALHGLRAMPRSRIEVVVPARSRAQRPEWIGVQVESDLSGDDVVTMRNGLRVIEPHRMLLELAARFNDHRFERCAEDAWHLKLVTPSPAAEVLVAARRRGRPGVVRFDRWLAKTGARSRPVASSFEHDVLATIRAVGLPQPQRQHRLVLSSGEAIHLDIAWPDIRLAVEPGHSWWHGGDLMVRRDMARDRACGELGWQVVRYDEEARRDLADVGRELRRIHAARRHGLNERRM